MPLDGGNADKRASQVGLQGKSSAGSRGWGGCKFLKGSDLLHVAETGSKRVLSFFPYIPFGKDEATF